MVLLSATRIQKQIIPGSSAGSDTLMFAFRACERYEISRPHGPFGIPEIQSNALLSAKGHILVYDTVLRFFNILIGRYDFRGFKQDACADTFPDDPYKNPISDFDTFFSQKRGIS